MSYQDKYEKLGKLTKIMFILCLVSMFVVYAQVVFYIIHVLLAKELKKVAEEDEINEFRKAAGIFIASAVLGFASFAFSMVMNAIVSSSFLPLYRDMLTSYPTPDPEELFTMIIGLFNTVIVYALPVSILMLVNAIVSRFAWTKMDLFFASRVSGNARAVGTKGTKKAITGLTLAIVSNSATLPALIVGYVLILELPSIIITYSFPPVFFGLLFLALALLLVVAICGLIGTIFQAIGINNVAKGFEQMNMPEPGTKPALVGTGGWNAGGEPATTRRDVMFDETPGGPKKTCPACGITLDLGPGVVFCPNCGHRLDGA